MIIKIKYGFYYKEMLYVWIKRELYRYPQQRNKYFLGLKKIEPVTNRTPNFLYYRLNKEWVSENKIKKLTTIVNIEPINIIKDDDLPF